MEVKEQYGLQIGHQRRQNYSSMLPPVKENSVERHKKYKDLDEKRVTAGRNNRSPERYLS